MAETKKRSGQRAAEVRRPEGRRAETKRAAIVDAARETFLANGYGVSMDTLAAEANVSKVTVYNHFGSKEALFIAIINHELDEALKEGVQIVERQLADSEDLRTDLIHACREWVAGIAAPAIMDLRALVVGELRRFPELGHAWQTRGPLRFHPVIAAALERLVKRGDLVIDDIELAVLQLSGLVVSPNLVYGGYGCPLTDDVRDQLIVSGVDMFLNRYAVRTD
ncbi:TetR/AcrR family transcriptional regulator [Nocardioides ginsengisoli]|uniref:TetR/AcrR family transcriptional regulator n=1 Tax=Nocardioides ginsengisoli TaxID=363868 RepID=A0ABW3W8Q1_9ACTN